MGAVDGWEGARVVEFVPFCDGWFDDEPAGPLVPLPAHFACRRAADGVFHWVPESTPEMPITSPTCRPSFAAVPALSSST